MIFIICYMFAICLESWYIFYPELKYLHISQGYNAPVMSEFSCLLSFTD